MAGAAGLEPAIYNFERLRGFDLTFCNIRNFLSHENYWMNN